MSHLRFYAVSGALGAFVLALSPAPRAGLGEDPRNCHAETLSCGPSGLAATARRCPAPPAPCEAEPGPAAADGVLASPGGARTGPVASAPGTATFPPHDLFLWPGTGNQWGARFAEPRPPVAATGGRERGSTVEELAFALVP